MGLLRYARSQLFGRCGALALRLLTIEAERAHGVRPLTRRARWALEWWLRYLDVAKPRLVRGIDHTPPTLLFTDGACDDGSSVVSVGAVLFTPRSRDPLFFMHVIPATVVSEWVRLVGSQTIGQAEIAPVLLAKFTWREYLVDAQCITFVDNDFARFALIQAYSPSLVSAGLLANLWMCEAAAGTMSWYERVASPSNVADNPSRLVPHLDGFNGRLVDPVVPHSWVDLLLGAAWWDGAPLSSRGFG